MDLSEVSAGTPKVLGHCLELYLNPHRAPLELNVRSAPVTPAKYASHPDIQFFRLVKSQHHYTYHKLKISSAEHSHAGIELASTLFDPYSRDLLLNRLRTFNALNWSIPSLNQAQTSLTELFCASYGWQCESISKNNNTKNHLRCTGCHFELILRFNSVEQQPAFAPFQFDLDDIQLLNANLVDQYILQVQASGHDAACSWTKVHTPLIGVYYLTPHLSNTNATLIGDYLKRLRNLTDNLPILQDHVASFRNLTPPVGAENLSKLVTVSNKWLLSRYFHDNKENFSIILDKMCPFWVYWLAAMGWDLNIQTFASQTVLLLICTSCNLRVFIKQNGVNGDRHSHLPVLSSSKILTPCTFPPSTTHLDSEFQIADGEDMDEDEEPDAHFCHKEWCLQLLKVEGQFFYEYFEKLVNNLEKNIGPQGEYLSEKDLLLDLENETPKKRSSIDIEDGLERFTKLRKLYFVD